MKNTATVLVLLASLVGCATGPTFQNYKEDDAACIERQFPSLIKFYAKGESHVFINEIDAVRTEGRGPYCFAPGKHRLGIGASHVALSAHGYIDLEFEGGKKYWLRANVRGTSFVFQLIDVTSPPGAKVTEFSLGSTPYVNPVIPAIPALPIK